MSDANAYYHLAMAYKEGTDFPSNPMESERLLRMASDAGHIEAKLALAHEYVGNTVQDIGRQAQAAKLYHEAASAGNVHAQFELGSLYIHGDGVPKDIYTTVFWWRKAALGNSTLAHIVLMKYYRTVPEVDAIIDLAHEYFKDPVTQYRVIPTLREAARLGNLLAQYELAVLLFDKKEWCEGIEWIQKTAKADYKDSRLLLERVFDLLSDTESDSSFDDTS